jgi:hypothetical protein
MNKHILSIAILLVIVVASAWASLQLPSLNPIATTTGTRTTVVLWNWQQAVENSSLTNAQKDDLLTLDPFLDVEMRVQSAANVPQQLAEIRYPYIKENSVFWTTSDPVTVKNAWRTIVFGSGEDPIMVVGENETTYIIEWTGSVINQPESQYVQVPHHTLVFEITVGTVE